MKKKIVLLACSIALFVACKKDDEDPQVLQITPEIVTGYLGKDYSVIEPSLKNKKDYQYTKLNNGQVEAAISLPAIDPAAPGQHYKLLLNLQSGNKVSIINLGCTDTLDPASGNKNFLYFYEHTAAKMGATIVQRQWVNPPNNEVTMVTPDSLVVALKAGKAPQPSLSWQTNSRALDLVYFSSERSFNMYLSGY
ncbi:hypothetical protein [Chitinophaga tropicalis]|uniref:Uncharacterized protein n=1 Tax=Chitinophaga tropicalis TaxID=2683588 RepID=A0A7K1U8E4_9BACT|nr:hypothetical protein [Chitinophaga tropicalis]MVT10550.1 hypothetical protein [Chitinophaga tropicalis]